MKKAPRWITGYPDDVGIWVVETRDGSFHLMEIFETEDRMRCVGIGGSEWFTESFLVKIAVRSYGPVSMPPESVKKRIVKDPRSKYRDRPPEGV